MLRKRFVLQVLVVLLVGIVSGNAQELPRNLPRCQDRPGYLDRPVVSARLGCLESVISDDSGGELGFTSLAVAPDGTLYAIRPLQGQVFALTDSDGDGLPDNPEMVADGLTLPNGLAYYDGALYISGGAFIYRFQEDGVLETLVDDLPSGGGFWTGGVTIGPDERIYVGIGAPCDFCVPDGERGSILSFTLDGSDRQVVAEGLRFPADLAFHGGVLWTVDTARDGLGDVLNLDELNRVTPGAHFGWPYCVGADNQPDLLSDYFDCADATAPAQVFRTHSTPLGLVSYTGGAFPTLDGALLVVQGGSHNALTMSGYLVLAVYFDEAGDPSDLLNIMPADDTSFRTGVNQQELNYTGHGIWPHRPFDVAVNPEGWVYISAGGGQIFVLRPH